MYNLFDHYLKGEYVYNTFIVPVCEKYGLTHMELTVMMFLANNPTLDTASDIVKCKKLTKSHVSTSIHSLENRGMIIGEYRNGNRRSVHLRLTDRANNIIADGKAAQNSFLESMFSGISDEERNVLTSIMERIDENINRHYETDRKEEKNEQQ